MAADMHVKGLWIGAQQMVVNCGDLDALVEQLGHDRIDFGFEQHQVAHHHCAAGRRLECDPATESECGPDCNTIDSHLKIGSREAVAVNLTGDGARLSQCCIDLRPVDLLSISGGNGQCRRASGKYLNST